MNVPRTGVLVVVLAAMIAAGTAAASVADTDTSPPFIFGIASGTQGANGWYVSDVSLSWSVSDGESPVSSTSGCEPVSVVADQPMTTYTCTATSDGGTASVSTVIGRDATAPEVHLVGGPQDGATYALGMVPAAPTCEAADATSGLEGDCAVSGYDAGVGSHTVTASATDRAGHVASVSHSYEVVEPSSEGFVLYGFERPVDMFEANVVQARRTVPLRFEVFDLDGQRVTSPAVVERLVDVTVDCASGAALDEHDAAATGATRLRHADQQFVFNWQVPDDVGTCHDVTVVLVDRQELTASFRVD